MLPGAGADIAAWIAYAVSKRFSSEPQTYGKGALSGLSDASGANNAALGSAWIPALVFGIPGDSVTAIAIGVLSMKNITPGPKIFDTTNHPEQAVLAASIFVTFLVANMVLIPVGLLAIRVGESLIRAPKSILLPAITLFCVVGAFAMQGSLPRRRDHDRDGCRGILVGKVGRSVGARRPWNHLGVARRASIYSMSDGVLGAT